MVIISIILPPYNPKVLYILMNTHQTSETLILLTSLKVVPRRSSASLRSATPDSSLQCLRSITKQNYILNIEASTTLK